MKNVHELGRTTLAQMTAKIDTDAYINAHA